jgi:phosphocarrier protein HPr
MITREIVVKSPNGLKSKTAAVFIHKTSGFKCSIWIENGDRKANAKSLLGLLSLGIACGTKVVIAAEGVDEEKAVSDLEAFLTSESGESN